MHSAKMSSFSCNENDNRKRPSSKYGIYNLQEGSQCVDNDKEAALASEGSKLLRTLSFSGTCKSPTNQSDTKVFTYNGTKEAVGTTKRISFYDNVPLPVARDTRQKSETSVHGPLLTVSDATTPRQFPNHIESDDDDLSSMSSPEYDEEYDGLGNRENNLHDICNDGINSKVVGSVDSGTHSSPILRSPRYSCNFSPSFCAILIVKH